MVILLTEYIDRLHCQSRGDGRANVHVAYHDISSLQQLQRTIYSTLRQFHSVLRVTLKDMSTWAVDVAGAQHGQLNAIVPFADYDRRFIAKNLGICPYGKNAVDVDTPVLTGNARDTVVTMQLGELRSHQADELAEWEYHNVTVRKLLKAKHEEYQSLKTDLVEYLAVASASSLAKATAARKLSLFSSNFMGWRV